MRKFLLYSSALAVLGLSGVAEAACIQTPSCSSLGYDSSTSCSGGVKCPFGNYWNCTGPNNTTEINKLKTEISGIKTDISNIKTNITNLTNRITNIENNSGSGSGSGSGTSSLCESCNVGDFICGGKCYASSIVLTDKTGLASDCTYYVSKKENGVCTRITTGYGPVKTLTAQEWAQEADFGTGYSSHYYNLDKLCRAVDWDESVISNMFVPVSIVSQGFTGNSLSFQLRVTRGCYPADIETAAFSVECDVNDPKTCFGNTSWSFRVPVESTF